MYKQWQRHNAPNGEHIWEGDKHIADITGESEEKIAEVAKFLVEAHNACIKLNPENPLAAAEAIRDMYEALEDIIEQADKTKMPLGADLADSIRVFGKQAIAKAKGR
jgi:hypothetical protein